MDPTCLSSSFVNSFSLIDYNTIPLRQMFITHNPNAHTHMCVRGVCLQLILLCHRYSIPLLQNNAAMLSKFDLSLWMVVLPTATAADAEKSTRLWNPLTLELHLSVGFPTMGVKLNDQLRSPRWLLHLKITALLNNANRKWVVLMVHADSIPVQALVAIML